MSKSAIKYINNNVSGRVADLLIDTLAREDVRKNWRNADVLARFLVDTVANAYECENSTTFADMDEAIAVYVDANLDDWTQESFLASSFGQRTAAEVTARLFECVRKNTAFENSLKVAAKPFYGLTVEEVSDIRGRVQRGSMSFSDGMWMLKKLYTFAKDIYVEDARS